MEHMDEVTTVAKAISVRLVTFSMDRSAPAGHNAHSVAAAGEERSVEGSAERCSCLPLVHHQKPSCPAA